MFHGHDTGRSLRPGQLGSTLDTSGHSPKQSGNRGCSAYYTRGLAPSASRGSVAESATHNTAHHMPCHYVQATAVRECISVLRTTTTTTRALSIFPSPFIVRAVVCGLWWRTASLLPPFQVSGADKTKKAKNNPVNSKHFKHRC